MINRQHSIHNFSFGEFVWWIGVVEDRDDPEKLGRVKVRIFGYHTSDKSLIPTDSLHWAYSSQPITSAATSGIGYSPTGMLEGTHCWGFFRDGHNAQEPVVVGTFAGVPAKSADPSSGFNDPNGKYPKWTSEADTSRYARGEGSGEPAVSDKNKNRSTGVSVAFGGTWDEPESPYDAKYPYNHVYESESGHLIEIDDTEGAERLHWWHRSGTYQEFHPNGDRVIKVIGDNYEVVAGDNYIHVSGDCNITVSGDANILVEGDTNLQTKGNHKEEVSGNYEVKVGGKYSVESGGKMSFKAPRIDLN